MTSEFTDQASNFKESHQEGRDEVHEVLHHMSQLFRSISGDAEQSKKLRELGVTDAMASFVQESLDQKNLSFEFCCKKQSCVWYFDFLFISINHFHL